MGCFSTLLHELIIDRTFCGSRFSTGRLLAIEHFTFLLFIYSWNSFFFIYICIFIFLFVAPTNYGSILGTPAGHIEDFTFTFVYISTAIISVCIVMPEKKTQQEIKLYNIFILNFLSIYFW